MPEPLEPITTPKCMVCGEASVVMVRGDGYDAWQAGALIQRALPELTNDERELLITGTHPRCWEVLNPDEDEEWFE